MAALAKDVRVVKTLPKNLKGARRKKEIPSFKVPHSASPYFYLHHVLPVLNKHSVVELVVSNGGCLQVVATCYWILNFIFVISGLYFLTNKYSCSAHILDLFLIFLLFFNIICAHA